nr:hypothetical protein CFP56_38736 [Quercus suber]
MTGTIFTSSICLFAAKQSVTEALLTITPSLSVAVAATNCTYFHCRTDRCPRIKLESALILGAKGDYSWQGLFPMEECVESVGG